MDLARALGFDPGDRAEFCNQVKLFKGHPFRSHSLLERRFPLPLTKEVMKDPMVVLESSQVYERTTIDYWFEQCIQDGRDPTCLVTSRVLKSLELKPNIGLAGEIEEWVGRVVEYQIKSIVQYLSEEPLSVDHVEHALDPVYKVS
ncbi:U-box domain-containing protein 44 [Glycine soja]|uniref:U-box domain-containing protein 44 n=1 Tax=Glycine soja TaxID=3848 RepID=A0A0B2RI77_GLYSO|nr:U-box domain-containing protein 44 [Glycine soja]